jgi:hypothetical protein
MLMFSRKQAYISLVLAVIATVLPNTARSDETESYRESVGGDQKAGVNQGTLPDAGVVHGPVTLYVAAQPNSNAKSRVSGGTLPTASLSAGDVHTFNGAVAEGDLKSGAAGGTLVSVGASPADLTGAYRANPGGTPSKQ